MQVAGLARRLHDSSTLQEKFEKLVLMERGELASADQKVRLDRRVPTRWNSDLACLAAHLHFEREVRLITTSAYGLEDFALSEMQWKLAKDLVGVLDVYIFLHSSSS